MINMNPLFDIACNFSSSKFDKDLDQVISRALENNVKKFLVTCSSIYDIEKVYNIYHEHNDKTFFTIGIHPHNAKEVNKKTVIAINEYIKKMNPHAVGEIGLDYFRNFSSYEDQSFAFEEQIKLSIENDLPLYLHQRDSHKDFMKILHKYSKSIKKGVVHCFTGTKSQLNDYLDLGLYIGLTGWICDEKRNQELRTSIKDIPIDKLMIETDCPYLIPKNLTNKTKNNRNEPSYLTHIAKEISYLMDIPLEEIHAKTYKNSMDFFS